MEIDAKTARTRFDLVGDDADIVAFGEWAREPLAAALHAIGRAVADNPVKCIACLAIADMVQQSEAGAAPPRLNAPDLLHAYIPVANASAVVCSFATPAAAEAFIAHLQLNRTGPTLEEALDLLAKLAALTPDDKARHAAVELLKRVQPC